MEYVYDGLGRRIEKNVDGTITRYVYDLEDILFEYDGSNTITARYTHGPGIDDPIGMDRGGKSYFYHADGLGSITDITDSTGGVVSSYQYDAFGNIVNQTGSLTNPYTYTSREYDPEAGLYYYRARYYDPNIRSFLQTDPLDMAMVILLNQYFLGTVKDPIGFAGGDVNLYGYVGNNPINWVDPWGLYTWPLIGTFPIPKGGWFGDPRPGRPHLGLDIAAPIGTPVVAIESGRVIATGFRRIEGYFVTYETRSGLQVQVYHLSVRNVKAGDWIYEGQKIGEVGETGCVTGPHLHIQIKPPGGTWVDPYPIIIRGGMYWNIG